MSKPTPSSDIAFTPAVKAVQSRRRSRAAYAEMEARGGFRTVIDESLVQFLTEVDTAYFATASADGQPYAQHRGGPKGFIRVFDETTLGFVDFAGNRQYVSTGNLSENDKAFLFLMDLMPEGYRARAEQVILFQVAAWDVNCPQHIPQKLDAADVACALDERQARIDTLEAENAALRQTLNALGDRS